jgi:hypothetical protein
MSEPTVAGQPLTDEQRAFLLAQQAQQAASSPSPAAAQAGIASQLAAGERGPLLPAEAAIEAEMARLRAQSEQMAALLATQGAALSSMQKQMEEAQAATGGPLAVRYATGVADKLKALADQWPNHPLGRAHFDQAHAAAADLADAAQAVVKGTGPVSAVHDAVAAIERFVTRIHPRQGGQPLDWSAIRDDLELAAEEAAKLVVAVA